MGSSLSDLFNNLAEEIHKIKCKNCKTCCLEYTSTNFFLIEYKCLCCKKNYLKKSDENLKKRFTNTYTFSNHDIDKFILLLQKVFTHMNIWMIEKNSMKHQ